MQKFGDKLREGLFFGLALGSGGSWSSKDYLVVDKEAFCGQKERHLRRAGVHRVKEIEVPGPRANDSEPRLQFPVAEGFWMDYSDDTPLATRKRHTNNDSGTNNVADPAGAPRARDIDDYTITRPRGFNKNSNDVPDPDDQAIAAPLGESDGPVDIRTPKVKLTGNSQDSTSSGSTCSHVIPCSHPWTPQVRILVL